MVKTPPAPPSPPLSTHSTRIDKGVRDFAWALATSVLMARREGSLSLLQEHLFVMQWLATAKKKRLFPKSAAREIEWFISEGRIKGPKAALSEKAQYLWMCATGNFSNMSDLRRITRFFEAIQLMGWQDKLITDAEWESEELFRKKLDVVWLRASELRDNFDRDNNLNIPLTLRLSHPWPGLALLARDARLELRWVPGDEGLHEAVLSSGRRLPT